VADLAERRAKACITRPELVNWRNETLGHGAFRLDPQDYLPDLEKHLRQINRHLAEQDEWGDLLFQVV
jgi:hypothetical protein